MANTQETKRGSVIKGSRLTKKDIEEYAKEMGVSYMSAYLNMLRWS